MSEESRYYEIGKERGRERKSAPLGLFNLANKEEERAAQRGWEAGQSAREHAEAIKRELEAAKEKSDTDYSSSSGCCSSSVSGATSSSGPASANGAWIFGIFLVGMVIVAVLVNSGRTGGSSTSTPPRAIQQEPVPVATQPQYPVTRTIAIDQNGWCPPVGIKDGEKAEWKLMITNAWLDMRENGIGERRQFPLSDSRWKPIKLGNATHTLEFRVTPGTPVQNATVQITIRQSVDGAFFANGNTLSSATPSLTDAGVSAGPPWPYGLQPTRIGHFPPTDYTPGNDIAEDTIYPIEDVLYIIAPGWSVMPFSDNGNQTFQAAADPVGFRIRPLEPDRSIIVKFKMTNTQNQNKLAPSTGLANPAGKPVQNWNSTPPNMRPVRPSYYPTSPTGHRYYYPSPRN